MYCSNEEQYHAGAGGDAYTARNDYEALYARNVNFLVSCLRCCGRIDSVLEYGPNVGYVLKALNFLMPHVKLSAVEINTKACGTLKERMPFVNVYNGSLLDENIGGGGGMTLLSPRLFLCL